MHDGIEEWTQVGNEVSDETSQTIFDHYKLIFLLLLSFRQGPKSPLRFSIRDTDSRNNDNLRRLLAAIEN